MLSNNRTTAVSYINGNSHRSSQHGEQPTPAQPDLHGASLVTESGQEIPITEAMIQKSLATFIDAWEQDHQD